MTPITELTFSDYAALCDDGTEDTVFLITCPDCLHTYEARYSAEYAAAYRHKLTGALDESLFVRDVVWPDWLSGDGSECRCQEGE